MNMRFDQPWRHQPSAHINDAGIGPVQCKYLFIASDGEDAAVFNRDSFGIGRRRISRENLGVD